MQQDRWGILYCPKGHNNKQRERIQKALDERQVQYDFVQSESTDSVERLVTMLIHNGYKTIIVVGGDSALNDAVNCLMKEEKQVRDQISLGVIPNGAMNDFARYWDFKEAQFGTDCRLACQASCAQDRFGLYPLSEQTRRTVPSLFSQLCQRGAHRRRDEPSPAGTLTARITYTLVYSLFVPHDIPPHGVQGESQD